MVEVSIRKYKFNHGIAPRGLGLWAFSILGKTMWVGMRNREPLGSRPVITSGEGLELAELRPILYSEAKKIATKYAKEHGAYMIYAMP